jgi:hypothetical protein
MSAKDSLDVYNVLPNTATIKKTFLKQPSLKLFTNAISHEKFSPGRSIVHRFTFPI